VGKRAEGWDRKDWVTDERLYCNKNGGNKEGRIE
jgi:hypothetical protein